MKNRYSGTPKRSRSKNSAVSVPPKKRGSIKRRKPRDRTIILPFSLDENGNATVYVDEKGRRYA
jgi:hypothetical protein